MNPPLYQRAIKIGIYILGGFVALGSVLDSVANALSLITPLVAMIGTVCIMLCWLLVCIILPYHPIPWVVGNQKVLVRKLGIKPTAFAVGMVLLLWIPSILALWQPSQTLEQQKTASVVPEKEIPKSQKRLTLYDTFQADFLYRQNKSESSRVGYSVNSNITHTFTSSDDRMSKVTSEYIIYKDFLTNLMFLVIYMPSSQHTYNIAAKISDDYKTILDHDARGITMTGKDPGDSATLDSKNIHFTRMIYIYHEDYLTLEQLGSLEGLYRAKNLSVQFRGRDYPVIRQLQESN